MNGTTQKKALEHLTRILSQCEHRDLDRYEHEELNEIIHELTQFQDSHCDDDLDAVFGLVATIISHIYVAQRYAGSTFPRQFDYYQHMNIARKMIKTVKKMM